MRRSSPRATDAEARGGARAQQHGHARVSCVCPPRRVQFFRHSCTATRGGRRGANTAQLATAVADRAQLSKADAKRALAAFDEVVLDQLGNAEKVRIGGLVQLTVRVKPAQKKRKGRNPATGEEITIAAKPASVDLRARPLARAKEALPSVQKARRRLAA
ncbi:MAG: HU family DNA-binding protein [Solirubrobacteraceae bacterium]